MDDPFHLVKTGAYFPAVSCVLWDKKVFKKKRGKPSLSLLRSESQIACCDRNWREAQPHAATMSQNSNTVKLLNCKSGIVEKELQFESIVLNVWFLFWPYIAIRKVLKDGSVPDYVEIFDVHTLQQIGTIPISVTPNLIGIGDDLVTL